MEIRKEQSPNQKVTERKLICSHTRAKSIADGAFIDITDTAKRWGLEIPVAVTSRLWEDCIASPVRYEGYDECWYLFDLIMLLRAVLPREEGGSLEGSGPHARRHFLRGRSPLYSFHGTANHGEPVIIVMLMREKVEQMLGLDKPTSRK